MGSLDLARFVILDSHQREPDPVNAIEKVLIHRRQKLTSMTMLFNSLKEKGFVVKGDAELVRDFSMLMRRLIYRQPKQADTIFLGMSN